MEEMIQQDQGEVLPDAGETPAQPQEVESPETAAQVEEKPKKAADPVQKRFDQLTWRAHEAERRANAAILAQQQAEAGAAEVRRQLAELHRQATMPRPEHFDMDPNRYAQAVQAHAQQFIEQERQQFEAAQRAREQQAVAARVQQAIEARKTEARTRFPDFDEVVGNPSLPSLPAQNPAVFQYLMEHDRMPELAYYLGQNPSEAHRIAALPPLRAIAEVAKIEAKLPDPSRKTSKAPPPPEDVTGKSGAVPRDPKNMTRDQYYEHIWKRGRSR